MAFYYDHHVPTDYSRIRADKGSGFIIARLMTDPRPSLTRAEVYDCPWSPYKNKFGPGYHSLLWSHLLNDGVVESTYGTWDACLPCCYNKHYCTEYKMAARGPNWETPRYRLTEKGREIFWKMKEAQVGTTTTTPPNPSTAIPTTTPTTTTPTTTTATQTTSASQGADAAKRAKEPEISSRGREAELPARKLLALLDKIAELVSEAKQYL